MSSCRRNRSPSVESRAHLSSSVRDEPSGRAVDRPEGSTDDEAVPSHSDTDESAVGELGGTGTRPPATPNPRCRPMRGATRAPAPAAGPYCRSDAPGQRSQLQSPPPARLPQQPPRRRTGAAGE